MNKLSLIIFDLDGTLVDAYRAVSNSINYAFEQMGVPLVSHEKIKRCVGWGERVLIEKLVDGKHVEKTLSIYRGHHRHALKSGVKFLPFAKDLLKNLKEQGYGLAIASNRPTRFTQIILKVLNITSTFDYVLCADKIKNPKPAPDILVKILQKAHLTPEQALYVGDMMVDIHTGRGADVKTVGVLTGSSDRKEIEGAGADWVIDNLSQLMSIINDAALNIKD